MYKEHHETRADNSRFWASHWTSQDLAKQFREVRSSELIPIFQKHLSQIGRVLEAGCGQGIYVHALRELGYNIEGVDFEAATVQATRAFYPDLPVFVGDVFQLPYPSDSFDAYISLGVIEHYEASWHVPVKEAARVLKDGGFLLLSVPYFNWFERLYFPLRDFLKKQDVGAFYQYHFRKDEIVSAIRREGFEVKNIEFYGKAKTLMMIPSLGAILKRLYHAFKRRQSVRVEGVRQSVISREPSVTLSLTQRVFDLLPNSIFAHMIMVVAEKKA